MRLPHLCEITEITEMDIIKLSKISSYVQMNLRSCITMPKVSKLGHVVMYAQDVPRLTEFYRDLFGFIVSARDPNEKVSFLAIDPHNNHHDLGFVSGRGAGHISFYVDSLSEFRDFYAALKSRDIPILSCKMVVLGLLVNFKDPEGNTAEVLWRHGKWGRFPFHRKVNLDEMTDEDILRIVDEIPLEEIQTEEFKTTDKVESVVRSYFMALNKKDIDQVTGLFTDDAVLMLNDSRTVSGKNEVNDMYKHRFSTVSFERDVHIDDLSVNGDLAVVRAHSTGAVTPLATGGAVSVLGREQFVLQKVYGAWRIRCYMMNQPKE